MASLRQIRRRMKSIQNIHEITKAMEMIAAFRFKKAENRFSKSRHYLLEMEKLVASLSSSARHLAEGPFEGDAALFEKRTIRKKALVVMTGDKGLCGAYNTNLLRVAGAWLKENKQFETYFVPVAKIGYEFLKKRPTPLISSYPEKAAANISLAKKITDDLKALFLSGKVDSIDLLYTSFRVGGTGQNKVVPFLSLAYLLDSKGSEKNETEYIYEPNFDEVFILLLSRYLEGKMYLALLESLTSEYSARMVAMKQATENGEEVLDALRLLRNKTRQATITRELSEIVSGASILV